MPSKFWAATKLAARRAKMEDFMVAIVLFFVSD
jgi:hypothetical protein